MADEPDLLLEADEYDEFGPMDNKHPGCSCNASSTMSSFTCRS
ncbi:hypothetical protein [Saccharomonospora piscinae]|nr:hypothetical protein [Saccharomonospora piscinae]